ncbi:MAG: hypothetical protein OXF11_10650, partial [Deltaproteobacteria bacterium]|nr:hypothetical protein [Deltaproteobacteria bacterium]
MAELPFFPLLDPPGEAGFHRGMAAGTGAGCDAAERMSPSCVTTRLRIGRRARCPREHGRTWVLFPVIATLLAAFLFAGVAWAQTTPGLSVADVTVSESAGNATFTVTLTETAAVDVTADYATSSSADATAATVGADFTASSGSVTIAAGQTEATFMVPVLSDIIDEQNETFTVTLSGAAPSGTVTISDATATGTITDDDDAPVPTVSVDTPIAEAGGTSTITVSTGTGSTYETARTVTLEVAGTATGGGTDYTISPSSLTLTLPAGVGTATSTVTATVTGEDDTMDDDAETIEVTARIGTTPSNTGTITITDDDAVPQLAIAVNPATIATEAGGTSTVTVRTTGASTFGTDQTITLVLSGTAGEEAAGVYGDYTIGAKSLVLPAGSGTVTTTVTSKHDIIDDNADGDANDQPETIVIDASNGGSAVGSATIAITDDDDLPTLRVRFAGATSGEGVGDPQLTLDNGTGSTFAENQTITLTYGGTADRNVDYTSDGSVVFPAGESTASRSVDVNFSVLQDKIHEGDETVVLGIEGTPTTYSVDLSSGQLTITDDDPAPQLEFTVSPASITERGGTSLLTIGTGSGSTYEGDEEITFTLAGGSTGESADYRISPSPPLTLPAGMGTTASTVTAQLTAVADTTPEDETLVLVAMRGTETIGTRTVTLTKPTLSIADATATETDASGTMNFTVTLSEEVNEQVTVDYATASTGATATAGADYTAATGTVTFAANATTASFAVTVLGDNIDESDQETF